MNVTPTTVTLSGAKGINGVQRSTTYNSVYCFDLKLSPRTAVSAGCAAPFRDAAARTYAANTSTPLADVNFGIVFI